MAKRALIRFDVNTSTSASAFSQSRNKLIASAIKHVTTNGLKNNILNVISKNDYHYYANKMSGLLKPTINNFMNLSINYNSNNLGSFMKLNNRKRHPEPFQLKKNIPNNSPIDVYANVSEPLNIQLFENKIITIYSHYSKNGRFDSYNYYMVNLFSNLVDNVFILSNLGKDKWFVSHSNVHILNYDFKSDFSNLYVFLMRYRLFVNNINRLFFINDSFLVADKYVFENRIKQDFFSPKHIEDYQGLILSNAYCIHYQSYFICINRAIINKVIQYFTYYKNPKNHIDAIHTYELGLSHTFLNKKNKYFCYNHNPTAYYPYEIIKNYGIIKRQQLLSTYNIRQQLTYLQIQQLKNTYRDNFELIDFINNYKK